MDKINLPSRLFVTGTDTGVGKTVISSILTAGFDSFYWKPIQSGLEEETDTEFLKKITELPDTNFLKETYRLNKPLSPHASAAYDGVTIDIENFNLPDEEICPKLIVEGAGGLMVPINSSLFVIDIIKRLELPVVIVSRSGLGTINHTLMSIAMLRQAGVEIACVVMNGPKNEINRHAIEHYGKIDSIVEIEPIEALNRKTALEAFKKSFMTL